MTNRCRWVLAGMMLLGAPARAAEPGLERVRYNHPGLVVDLGVGLWAWPLPMDSDGDGDLDLVVSCPDKPSNGVYVFENPGGGAKMPVFKPAVRIGPGLGNIQPSYVGGQVRLLTPAKEWVDFRTNRFGRSVAIYPTANVHPSPGRIRANQWKYADHDGDGRLDLIVGVEDWSDYGWDNAFDSEGRWTRGPLHGHIYLLRNRGTGREPEYEPPVTLEAGGRPVDTFGMPSPNLADFDGDGDLDLLCGEFLDRFTYFQNVGTRQQPEYSAGRRLTDEGGTSIAMDLQMIVPVALDWDGDGDVDLVVGDEDGRVALVEHTGNVIDGLPRFRPPAYFRQEAADVKFGALVTPCGVDWDGDGDEDLVCGNSAGYLGLIENLGGGNPPRWAAPRLLEAGGRTIRIQAGSDGSIQGPCEAKWGYTAPSVADWDRDGRLDVVANSIWGEVVWFRNVGTRRAPALDAARPIEVEWPSAPPKPAWFWWNPRGQQLVTQWRTTPVVVDLNGDGLPDLVMLDPEGYLALFERADRSGTLVLLPGRRAFTAEPSSVFDANHKPLNQAGGLLRLNAGTAGASGRRKLCLADWDRDGRLDLLVNSRNVNVLRNTTEVDGVVTFRDLGAVDSRVLAGHDTSPTVVDWDKDGVSDLLVGAEDGHLYYLQNPRAR